MAKAYDAVPPKLWEAPKVDELVNQTGDGARRTRVNGALGTYCITERGTSTSTEQVERDGKLRLTTCPQHEDTATQQDWRTARD
jgi:competence protein ComGC